MSENTQETPLTIAVAVGWFVTGTLWFAQALVPWTDHGTLSQSSSLDAASLIRSGAVGSLAPTWAGWLLLVLPVMGLVLGATAFSRRPLIGILRIFSLILAISVTTALTHYLAHFHISNFGAGALLAWLGCMVFVISLVASQRNSAS